MEIEVCLEQERLFFLQVVRGKKIGIITRSWLSSNENMWNLRAFIPNNKKKL